MARQRDYKAEYARRIANAKAKAAREGKTFDKAKARGHKSKVHERKKRLERYQPKTDRGKLYRLTRYLFIPDEEVRDAIDMGYPIDGLIDLATDTKKAQDDWETRGDNRRGLQNWKARDDNLSDWWYYYHGAFGA